MKVIDDLLYKASEIASAEIERLARNILKKHTSLDEFCMGMGSWSFTKKGLTGIAAQVMSGDYLYLKPLDDFINEYDRDLHVTGEPMRFTANGEKTSDWGA